VLSQPSCKPGGGGETNTTSAAYPDMPPTACPRETGRGVETRYQPRVTLVAFNKGDLRIDDLKVEDDLFHS
jgi:hypothetical protein